MSETLSPTPVVPDAAAPGPAIGTAPEAAPPASPAAPAPLSSPETAPAAAEPTSLLSGAKGEAAPAAPPPELPAAEQPKPEAPAAEIAAPTYEPFTLPEGVTLQEEKLGAFTGILGQYEAKIASTPAEAHAATQELGQKLVDLYLSETQANAERFSQLQRDTWQRTREDWLSQFRDDPQIGQNRQDATVARCGALLEMYGQRVGAAHEQALRSVMALTGAGDNPEMLRFINWAASFAVEQPRMVPANGARAPVLGSRATRLYRNSIGNGAM
jgi:hypothetical protein